MARTLGYILGALLLFDGLFGTLQPRKGFELYDRGLRRYYPKPMQRLAEDYRQLSDPAIQYLSGWLAAIGGLLLLLSSKARS